MRLLQGYGEKAIATNCKSRVPIYNAMELQHLYLVIYSNCHHMVIVPNADVVMQWELGLINFVGGGIENRFYGYR